MVAPVKNGNAYRIHSGGGGRQYGFMLLLAVGAAILGFTVLHKLREGRIFSLLVKEKDHELLSLHLLLQREQDFSKEVRTKLEEMKSSMYTVKAQKSDVEGRLLEVESLVSSLKDEQKILESQLEEKRNEIKMLSQQKQMTMIDDPKSHSEEPSTVWSGISQGSNNETQAVDDKQVEQSRKPKQSENGNGTMTGSNGLEGDGSDSGIRVKSSKQRKLRGKRWLNLIKRFKEQKDNNTRGSEQMSQNQDGHLEYKSKDDSSSEHDLSSLSNQDGANMGNKGQDEHATLRTEGLPSMDKNVTYSRLDDNAEMKERLDPELDPDSSARKMLDSEPDSDSSSRRILDSEPDPDSSDGKVMGSEPDPDSSLEKVLSSEADPDSSVGKGLSEPDPDSSVGKGLSEPDPDSSLEKGLSEPDPDSSLEKGLGDQDSSVGKVPSFEPTLDLTAGKVLSSEPILDPSVVKLQGSEPYPDSSAGNGLSYESDPDSSVVKVMGSASDPDSSDGKVQGSEPDPDSSTKKVLDSQPDPDSSSGIVLDSEPDPDSSSRDALDSEPDPDSSSGKVEAEGITEEETLSNKDDELSNKTDETVDDML